MSARTDAGHVAHLLPGYAAGTLDAADRPRVLAHLTGCPACRAELAAWRAIGAAAREDYGDASPDDGAPLRAVWHRIDATAGGTGTKRAEAERRPLLESAAPTPARARPSARPLVRRSLNQLAMAALLLLTLAGVYVGLVQHRIGSDGTAPDAADVPLFRGGPARTGELPGPGPQTTPAVRWSVGTGRYPPAPASVADGVVYVGTLDGALLALDASTGAERWRYQASGPIGAAPAVADGVVYVGDQTGLLHAVDAETGRLRWQADVGGPLFASSPAVVAETVYVVSETGGSSPAVVAGVVYVGGDHTPSRAVMVLHALDAATGAERWRHENRRNGLYAVDAATGQPRWHVATGGYVRSTPAVAAGVVYVGSQDGTVYAVDVATGAERWRVPTGKAITAPPAVADGTVYVGSTDGVLYALEAATGAERWRAPMDGPVRQSAPAVADGSVYVVAGEALRALDSTTGTERWRLPAAQGIDASPVVAGGLVYLGARASDGTGVLLALGEPPKDGE